MFGNYLFPSLVREILGGIASWSFGREGVWGLDCGLVVQGKINYIPGVGCREARRREKRRKRRMMRATKRPAV